MSYALRHLIIDATLDLTASESRENRKVTLDIVRDGPSHLGIRKAQRSLLDFGDIKPAPIPELSMPNGTN